MIERLSAEQLEGILDALPFNFIFVDDSERLIYRNKDAARGATGAPSDILDKDIRGCHKPSSLPRLEKMVEDFKSGARDEDEFWIMGSDRRILNRFLAVRDRSGKYLGMIEYLLDFTAMEELAEAKKDSYARWPDSPLEEPPSQ
jgi:DUF438 domain-containing protein